MASGRHGLHILVEDQRPGQLQHGHVEVQDAGVVLQILPKRESSPPLFGVAYFNSANTFYGSHVGKLLVRPSQQSGLAE